MIRFPHRRIVPGLVPVTKSETSKLRGCSLPPLPDIQLVAFFSTFMKRISIEYWWNGIGKAFAPEHTVLKLWLVAWVPDRDHGEYVNIEQFNEEPVPLLYDIGRWIEDRVVQFVVHEAHEGLRINGSRLREEHPELDMPF